jgi:hypothetical protein
MSPTTIGLIGLAILIIVLFSRMPVGFVMALIGVLGFSYVVSWEAGMRIMAKDFFGIFGSYSLTVVPLFILMGQVTFLFLIPPINLLAIYRVVWPWLPSLHVRVLPRYVVPLTPLRPLWPRWPCLK